MALDLLNANSGDSGRMTPEAIARQRKILDALYAKPKQPIQHWMQGVAQLADTAVNAVEDRKLTEAERANAAESAKIIQEAYGSLRGLQGDSPAQSQGLPQSSSLPPGGMTSTGQPQPNTTGKIYSNDEPSPLDPPSGQDRDKAVRTIIAEAGNQGPVGMQAVASVIRNRAANGGYGGDTASGVVTARNQFEPWNTAAGRSKMAAIDPNSREYQAASAALDRAYTGDDPTNGAKNFIEPRLQTSLGRPMPAWAQGPGQMIGDHKFIGGAPRSTQAVADALGQPAPYQVAGTATAAPSQGNDAMMQTALALGTTGGAPQQPQGAMGQIAQALGSGGRSATQPTAAAPAPSMDKLIQAASNPYISDDARKAVMGVLNALLAGQKVSTVDLGNAIGVMDQRGNLLRSIPKGEPNKGPEFGEVGTDPNTGEKIMGWRDPRSQTVTPYQPPAPQGQGSSVIPQTPAGVDPKVWRKAQSERATADAMPADPKSVSALRNEVQGLPSYKNLAQAAPVYKSMTDAAGRDNRAADVNLIYGLAKVMDPGSVVRESEMSVAQAIATLPQRLQAEVKSQMASTGRLSPELRSEIMTEAHSRVNAYRQMFDQDAQMYRGIAERGRMNIADVLPDFGEFAPWSPPKAAAPATTSPAPNGNNWNDAGNGVRIREKR